MAAGARRRGRQVTMRRSGPVTNAIEQAWRSELMSRPLVQLLQPRADDAVIQQSAEPELVTEVKRQAVAEGVLVWKHGRQLEEDPRHAQPGIAEERGERLEPAQCDAGSRDEGVGIQHGSERGLGERRLRLRAASEDRDEQREAGQGPDAGDDEGDAGAG